MGAEELLWFTIAYPEVFGLLSILPNEVICSFIV